MRTTIEISEELINELLKLSGARKKKDAVRIALEDYVRRKNLERLLSLRWSENREGERSSQTNINRYFLS